MSDFLLSLKDVSLAFGGPAVLDGVSLSISRGLRAALTGRNGEGKSTLLKLLAGELEPDEGEVVRSKGLTVAYVGQRAGYDDRHGVLNEGLLDLPLHIHFNDLLVLKQKTLLLSLHL